MSGKYRGGKQKSAFWIENECRLRELATAGETPQQAADALGITKNAAVGAAFRLGVLWSVSRPQAPVPVVSYVRNEFPAAGHCLWPHGHPGDDGFGFCADSVEIAGKPYCAPHAAIAYSRKPLDTP